MSKMNSAMSGAAAGASMGGPWGAVAGGAAGYLMGSDDQSDDTLAKLMLKAQKIPLPILKEYYPELYADVVSLNPELEGTVNLGPSQMAGISTDPNLRQAQLNALSKLQEVGDAGGRDAQFLADQARLENDINTNLRGNQDAIAMNMATRGQSGGGMEMVARNMAAQSASNTQAQMAMDSKAAAEKRALDALIQSGQLGGQMQAQDFSQAAQKAQAADAIAKFNAQNQQQVISNNTATKNNAQQWNAQNKQATYNNNTELKNNAQQYNLGLAQQNYDNELKKYGLVSGATTNYAQNQANQAKENNQFMGNLISAGATAYGANQKKSG